MIKRRKIGVKIRSLVAQYAFLKIVTLSEIALEKGKTSPWIRSFFKIRNKIYIGKHGAKESLLRG